MTRRLLALGRRVAVSLAGLLTLALTITPAAASTAPHQAQTPIKHFIYLMQGGRSFDNYFGTYPGAAGLAASACQLRALGKPSAGCVRPFVLDGSRPARLGATNTVLANQVDGGKMDGFVAAFEQEGRDGAATMGYYDSKAVPFYWSAARSYVLFDEFFASTDSGIRDNRSYWVSAQTAPGRQLGIPAGGYGKQPTIFDELQSAGVSWKFYVEGYNPTQTYQTVSSVNPETQTTRVPLVDYWRFTHDPALASHIVGLDQYYRDLRDGTLPAVAYIASAAGDDERSAQSIPAGQRTVSTLVSTLMQSRYWDSSALLVSYDGSGGWYDGVPPPKFAGTTLGLRVPALLISAYAPKGLVNHTVLDYTSALKFIEQNWQLPALTARDAAASSISSAFNFQTGPRPPVLLSTGLDPQLDALPRVHQPSRAKVLQIYVLYGVVGALAILLPVFAAAWPRLGARRRTLVAGPGAAVGGDSG
jgi:phospholipase C